LACVQQQYDFDTALAHPQFHLSTCYFTFSLSIALQTLFIVNIDLDIHGLVVFLLIRFLTPAFISPQNPFQPFR
jgi:hypothetical protein